MSCFLLRGLDKVEAEMGITFLAYNLLRCSHILGNFELIKRLKALFLVILGLRSTVARQARMIWDTEALGCGPVWSRRVAILS